MKTKHFFVYDCCSKKNMYDSNAVNFWNEKMLNIKTNKLFAVHYMISDETCKNIISSFIGNYLISWNYNTILKNIYIFDKNTHIQFKLQYNLKGETFLWK
jgi:hypothetical protein